MVGCPLHRNAAMAKREISSTLKNLKFMQRAAQREEKPMKEEEVKPDGNFSSPGTFKRCVVIMEGDPHPGAVIGRMSFRSFNPSVDKLNEEASNPHTLASNSNATSFSGQRGKTSFREDESQPDRAASSNSGEQKSESNGDLKRKHSEVVSETQNSNGSSKTQGGQLSSPNSSKRSFKQPKHGKLDWSVLMPKGKNRRE
ncbi:hypothetical protein Tsubulata_038671 [Turnera subulata]|uniref:M-phase phosphoprotein 6 n=1 Tax=Turnera subulata TaxID=218843 RepID=A0A9Q0FKQ4_9ROSI|nr:hypothetical protein Tsubulata_038671 [Turnera subulata]